MIEGIKKVDGKKVKVAFDYRETFNNVYKHFRVFIDDKRSNVKSLYKLFGYKKEDLPGIFLTNTYFWSGKCNSMSRIINQARKELEVKNWLIKEGFEVKQVE